MFFCFLGLFSHWTMGSTPGQLRLFSICVPLDGKYAEKLCEKLAKCHVRINENINKAINQAQSNRNSKATEKWK